MALINCPECNSTISDKALQCPKCGYPLTPVALNSESASASTTQYAAKMIAVPQVSTPPPQAAPPSPANQLMYLPEKKSETLAFVLPFFFSILGVFYADVKKAGILLGISIGLNFIIAALFHDAPGTWLGIVLVLNLIFWIISIVVSLQTVSRHNSSLTMQKLSIAAEQNNTDVAQSLYIMIQGEKGKNGLGSSGRDAISRLLADCCNSEEQAKQLIIEYRNRFHADLIAELSTLSKSYQRISELLAVFIHFGIVSPAYPHTYLVNI